MIAFLPQGASYRLSLLYLQNAWDQKCLDFKGVLFIFFFIFCNIYNEIMWDRTHV